MEFATIFVGLLGVWGLGMSFWSTVLAIVIGTGLGAVTQGLLSTQGPRFGVPQMVLSRLGFGYWGNSLPAGINAITAGIGWFAVNSVSGTLALNSLTHLPEVACLLIIVVVQIVVIQLVMIADEMVDVMVVHHVLEIPARLLVVMLVVFVRFLQHLFVFVNDAAVADIETAFAFEPAVPVAGPQEWPAVAVAVPVAGLVDEAIVRAMPAFQPAIVIAPPVAVAAFVGAAPIAEIVFLFAVLVRSVAIVFADPALPAAIVAAVHAVVAVAVAVTIMPAFATVVTAAAIAIPAATAVELDGRDRIERIEQDGIGERNTAIFVGASGLPGDGARRCETHCQRQCPEQENPGLARRLDGVHHGDLLQ